VEGFQIVDGDCEQCTSSICSCKLGNNFYDIYAAAAYLTCAAFLLLLIL
jgi:hypothetical protein